MRRSGRRSRQQERVEVPIAPMIDVVFLLLIYFMVATNLEQQEADLSFQLPGVVAQDEPLEMPDEQIIDILDDGQIVVNEYPYDRPDAIHLRELSAMLAACKQACDANKTDLIVTIAPGDAVRHERIVRVMDACTLAGVKAVHFAMEAASP